MNNWHEVFVKSGCLCTQVVKVLPSMLKGNDYDIYKAIVTIDNKKKLEKAVPKTKTKKNVNI